MRDLFQSLRDNATRFAILIAIAAVMPVSESFAFQCFTVADSGNLLIEVDESNANETVIGSTATAIEAIAFDPSDGTLYGSNQGQLGTLNKVDGTFTATASTYGSGSGSAGTISFTDIDGLAFSATTGTLYGSHRVNASSDVLIQINKTTGAHVADAFGSGVDYVVIAVTGGIGTDDIALDPTNDTMYAVVNNGNGVDAMLVTVNKTTGATTIVGDLETSGGSPVADMEGLGVTPDGTLYGTTGTSGPASTDDRLWIINKSTAVVTLVGAFSAGGDYEAFDCNSELSATPTATATATNTPTDTATATVTNTAADTATATGTATNTATATFTATNTPADTATATGTATNTAADTATATATSTSSATSTATATSTVTDTPTATPTPDLCGDGTVDAGEICDDGNEINGDGCEDDCTISAACTYIHGGTPLEVYVNDGVGNDGVGAPAGCASGAFASIQSAIDDASVSDGDIVWVCPGSYAESVVVSKEVTVRSTGGAATTSVTSSGTAFDVRRSGVSIVDLTIEAVVTGVSADSICPLGQSSCAPAEGSNLTISGNTIENSNRGVAWQSRVHCALIQSNTMTGNAGHIDIAQTAGTPAFLTIAVTNSISGGGGSGESVRMSGLGPLTLFLANLVDGSAGDGVVVESVATDARIEENNIRNSTGSGILVLPGAAGTRVRQNNIENNGTGLTNQAPEGVVEATLNWWGSQGGPFHVTDLPTGVGNAVVESGSGLDTDFIEFLCGPAPGGFPSVNALCGDGGGAELNFVAFGRQPDVSPNGRFLVFVSDKDLNGDAIVTIDNSDGGDEVFLLNRKPGGKDVSFCLGGSTPGAVCQSHRDCPADFLADPIINEGVCVLLTQLSNDASGSGISSDPRVTRNGNVFFATDADLLGLNADGSSEVHVWSRRDYRKQDPADPNTILSMLSNGSAGLDSDVPGSDRGGRRRVFMQSAADPTGNNGDGNVEIMVLDVKKNVWTQITDSTGTDNLRPSTQTGRQVLFDSEADLTGGNADGNREIFLATFKRSAWVMTQITDSLVVENHAGSLSKRGKILVFSSTGDYDPSGDNSDGNREIFLWEKGDFEQVTFTTVGENVNPQSNSRGRFVAFESTSDVEDNGDNPTNRRVHLFDRKNGTTLPLSRSFFGENTLPHISQGRFVVWESTANLTGNNPAGETVIYLFDRRKDD